MNSIFFFLLHLQYFYVIPQIEAMTSVLDVLSILCEASAPVVVEPLGFCYQALLIRSHLP